MASILEKIFLPKSKRKSYTSDVFIRDLNSNKFRNNFNLGVCEEKGGSWLMKDFTKEPNALYVGAMGSGKSMACRFTLTTWLLANSDQTILFIVDTVKGAQDYKLFFQYDQVYPVFDPEGVHKVIDLVYEEAMARKDKFAEVGANSILAYEEKTGEKIARCIVLLEEFHSLTHNVINFEKEFKIEGTTANKFHTLMRIGRSLGTWFCACSQKSTKSDIPSEVVPNFTQKLIFKVSRAEASYVLGNDNPARLRTDQQGRCFTDFGEVQFPFIDDSGTKKLLDHYVVENDSTCARLTPSMIKDVLAGKSTREQYKHKKLTELARIFPNVNSQLVVTMLHEAMGCPKIEELNMNSDKFNISHIITFRDGTRTAVMIKTQKKISGKHINQLMEGIEYHNCQNGILYTSAETPSQSMYKQANSNNIELVDQEDIIHLAQRIEDAQEQGLEREFSADKLASDDKESGVYHSKIDKEDKKKELVLDKSDESLNEFLDDLDIEETIDSELPKIHETKIKKEEAELDDFFNNEIDEFNEEDIEESSVLDIQEEFLKKENSIFNVKKQKRPTLNISFNLSPEDSPSVLISCLRTESNEVYRILTYVILNNKIHHKYYFDLKVDSEFSYAETRKIGIKNKEEWNEDPMVVNKEKLRIMVKRYLENFIPCENLVYINCWDKDLSIVKEIFIEQSDNLIENPLTHEEHFLNVFGIRQSREDLIKEFNLKSNPENIFEDIEIDYQIWSQTI